MGSYPRSEQTANCQSRSTPEQVVFICSQISSDNITCLAGIMRATQYTSPMAASHFTLRKHLAGSNGNSFSPEWNGLVSMRGSSIALSSICAQYATPVLLAWESNPPVSSSKNNVLVYKCVFRNTIIFSPLYKHWRVYLRHSLIPLCSIILTSMGRDKINDGRIAFRGSSFRVLSMCVPAHCHTALTDKDVWIVQSHC